MIDTKLLPQKTLKEFLALANARRVIRARNQNPLRRHPPTLLDERLTCIRWNMLQRVESADRIEALGVERERTPIT